MTLPSPVRRSVVLVVMLALVGCSSSFGSGGGGSPPAKTYVVLPNGKAVPADTP